MLKFFAKVLVAGLAYSANRAIDKYLDKNSGKCKSLSECVSKKFKKLF